jgi:hypothetical protein
MIQVQLTPDTEARVQAHARAQGISAESLVQKLIEDAIRPVVPRRSGPAQDMDAFFQAMAANSDKFPVLPDEAFTRKSFYSDHD